MGPTENIERTFMLSTRLPTVCRRQQPVLRQRARIAILSSQVPDFSKHGYFLSLSPPRPVVRREFRIRHRGLILLCLLLMNKR